MATHNSKNKRGDTMSHWPSNGVTGCTSALRTFYRHPGFDHTRRALPCTARQGLRARQPAVRVADIIDTTLKPATFTLEPYSCLGQVCMTGSANLRVCDHTTLSPSIRVARARAPHPRVATASGLGFALFVQQLVIQNAT